MLAADFFFDGSTASQSLDLELSSDGTTIELIEHPTGTVVHSQLIAGSSGNVIIFGSDSSDHLEVGSSVSNLSIQFDAGDGIDQLTGPSVDSRWQITGENSGELNSNVSFSSVENLQGAADNQDHFVLNVEGKLSGLVHGGDRGFDTLEIDGGSFGSASFEATGPDSGFIDLDGNRIEYAGLEPIDVVSGIDHLEIDLSKLDISLPNEPPQQVSEDIVTLKPDPSGNYDLTIQSDNASSTFETVNFDVPNKSLTIYLGGGEDQLSIDGLGSNFAADLFIYGDDKDELDNSDDTIIISDHLSTDGGEIEVVAESLTLQNGLVLSSRDVDANDTTEGDSGAITLEVREITLGDTSSILADVDDDSGFYAGDIWLWSKDIANADLANLSPLLIEQRTAFIDVGDMVTISGENVWLTAQAEDRTIQQLTNASELTQNLVIGPLQQRLATALSLPGKVLTKASDASISVGDRATITANDYLAIESSAVSNASGIVASELFSVGYVDASANSSVLVYPNVTIATDGPVSIGSYGQAIADIATSTDKTLGTFPSNGLNIAASLAVAASEIVSTVTVSDGVTISAGKSVNVAANGASESAASAESGTYDDGRAGLAAAIELPKSTIRTDVDGTIIANAREGTINKIEFDPTVTNPNRLGYVDASNDTIHVGPHALTTGDSVVYSNRTWNEYRRSGRGPSCGRIGRQPRVLCDRAC